MSMDTFIGTTILGVLFIVVIYWGVKAKKNL